MLGKRSHQIQRTTSMSQLRVPPSARTRPSPDFAQAKKDLNSKMANNSSSYTKNTCTHHMHPKVLEDATHVETKIKGLYHGNKVNVDVLPMLHTHTRTHAHTHGHLKASHSPLKVASSTPLPLLTKHTISESSESFMDACYSCKKPLGHGRDIFMYRGDAAFCTEECRLKQIACDERRQKRLSLDSKSTGGDNTIGNPKNEQIAAPTGAL